MGNANPGSSRGPGGQPPGATANRQSPAAAPSQARAQDRVIPFGKYILLDRLAVGGMAEVYTAKSFGIEGFEKIIAIKRILPTMAEDDEFIQMFIDEAKIAGQLSHAHIVPIYELGKIGGSHYIAMEFVWGKDLLQIMNRFRRLKTPMPPSMAAFVASKMCEALDFAHRKRDRQGNPMNIIHRDVSPQNVLVSYEGQVKLIDFGIAKAAARTTNTQAGVLKGKFGYMSPEQVRGGMIDARSDLFAVGTCVYEMLTSERLFTGESDFVTLEKVRHADVAPLARKAPHVPAELTAIVMRALTREPADRWQSASEMLEALQRFLASERPPFNSARLQGWMRQAFATELEGEKARLDGWAKIGRPASAPPSQPPSYAPGRSASPSFRPPPPPRVPSVPPSGELEDEATVMTLNPLARGGPSVPARPPAQEPTDEIEFPEELPGAPTQIFFSADDLVEEPDSAQIVSPPGRMPSLSPPFVAPGGTPAGASSQRSMPALKVGVATPPVATFEVEPPVVAPTAPPSMPAAIEATPNLNVNDTVQVPAMRLASARWLIPALVGVAGLLLIAVVALGISWASGGGGIVEIHVTPSNVPAIVLLDGQARGQAPVRLEGVAEGDHLIEIRASGYQVAVQSVPVTRGGFARVQIGLTQSAIAQPPPTVTPTVWATAPPPPAPPPVAAPPAEAPIMAPPPVEPAASAAIASADVQAEEEPQEDQEEERRIRDRRPRVDAPTTPRAPAAERGSLLVQAVPWARIFIDGRDTRQNTPTVRPIAISAGRHTIGLRTADGVMHDVEIEVEPGQTVRIARRFE